MAIFKSRSDSPSFLSKTLFGENASSIGLYLIFITIVLLLVFHFLSRRKKQLGKLIFTSDKIETHLQNKTYSFNISEIKGFELKIGVSDGRREFRTLISSYDNWLFFEDNNIKYNYQFVIDSDYASKQLTELINIWKSNNSSFKVK